MTEHKELRRLENFGKTYRMGDTEIYALQGVTLTINTGDVIAIMGPSGSGTSTLMNLIGGLDSPSQGKYWLNGRDISSLEPDELAGIRKRQIGFVFRNFNLLFRTTAQEKTEPPLIDSGLKNAEMQKSALADEPPGNLAPAPKPSPPSATR